MWRFRGLAAPYDVVAHKSRKRWRFSPGALTVADGRVDLLRDHDQAQRIGRVSFCGALKCRCRPVSARPDGLWMRGWTRWPVTAGMGLSIGFTPIDVDKVAGERVVRSAVIEEVSIVQHPAWPACVITEVEEVVTWPRTLAHT